MSDTFNGQIMVRNLTHSIPDRFADYVLAETPREVQVLTERGYTRATWFDTLSGTARVEKIKQLFGVNPMRCSVE